MGYSITIGQLVVEKNEDDGLDCSCINFGAEGFKHDNAPAFGEPTDFTSERWPSYSSWSNALESAGVYDLFFDHGHLIGGHPGVRLITKDLISEFGKRKATFEARFPEVKASYGNVENLWDEDKDNPECNSTYCRIVWLDYWMNWAFENCETPVIANT